MSQPWGFLSLFTKALHNGFSCNASDLYLGRTWFENKSSNLHLIGVYSEFVEFFQ
jgi:hypothetical protein